MKIALIGYGKMGRMIEKIALQRGHEIVCKIDVDNTADFGSPEFASADVAIEFSVPTSAVANYRRAFDAGIPVVSGTTGWLSELGKVSGWVENERLKFLYSSNFSVGVNLFMAVNRYLARIIKSYPQYTPSEHEIHHIHKLDHPSGTAITLAEELVAEEGKLQGWTEDASKSADRLLITHEREGEVPGTHIITWDSEVDKISIKHEAKSREGFALGAVIAAEWLYERVPGIYTMRDVMTF